LLNDPCHVHVQARVLTRRDKLKTSVRRAVGARI